ncbi:MAG TPA: serine hydrolase domain-containing protein [Flavisolibacter sp.]|jgi:D-alanyl-D-alanine carboxypeptidase|nr:serine hydrolase domain-containing protein [Flavisolibacter sp.]
MKTAFAYTAVIATLFLASCQKSLLEQKQQYPTDNVPVNTAHPMKDSLQHIINKYVAAGLPGVQVAVKNGDGFYATSAGYAKLESKTPLAPGSPSWLFSLTKTYTAVLVMKQKEKGAINLDQKITLYLPADVSAMITNAGRISVRMLLNHTSGIVNVTELSEFMVRQFNNPLHQPSVSQLLSMLKGKPQLFEPGTDYSYSNSNYLLLQTILEKVTNTPYQQLLKQEILSPLQLQHTWYDLSEGETVTLGFPNYYFDRFANNQLENVSRWNTAIANGSRAYGGIGATPFDVLLFFESLVQGTLLSPASLQEMKTWVQGKESTQPDYGLGLEFYQYHPGSSPQFGHEGDGIGSTTQVFYVPDNNTFLYINCTAGRKIFGPYLFKTTDLKNELCRYVAKWR